MPHAPRLRRRSRALTVVAAAGAAVVALPVAASAAAPTPVLSVDRIASQSAPVLPGSEPDTLVEPDIAASPTAFGTALAVAHSGRYADGGAVGIEYSWTGDGGRSWQSRTLPKLTKATGGPAVWTRASDPVAAYGPDGTAYVSTLLIGDGCDSAVAVSRSTNGGRTFGAPVLAHRSSTCTISDDKNWLVVDTSPASPHQGRIYQFWTPFLFGIFGYDGSPQALVWSDDHGRTWSRPVNVSPPHANTQNSQPMLLPDGTIVDAYTDYGQFRAEEGPEVAGLRQQTFAAPAAPGDQDGPVMTTRVSKDGGRSWTDGGLITRDLGDGPAGIRCCLSSATADPKTGKLYAVWNAKELTRVRLSSSTDGVHWSPAQAVNPTGPRLGVNADVSAYGGTVSVSYGTTNPDVQRGRFAQQYVVTSHDAGATFAAPVAIGPVSNYAQAAYARGIFPGDYIGTAMTQGRLYAVWCVSRPVPSGARYHQVVYGAVLGV